MMSFGLRILLLILAASCAVISATAEEDSSTTQDIREEDLDVIHELQNKKFSDNDLKDIETLLSTNTEDDVPSKTPVKTSRVKKGSQTQKKNNTVKDKSVEKTPKTTASKVEQNATSKKKSEESTKSMLDAIVHRIMSQYDRKAVGKGRTHPSTTTSTDTKVAENLKDKTLSSLSESNAQKFAEKSKSFIKLKTNMAADTDKKQNDRDKVVFSRLEGIAHNILRVLKNRERTSEGLKLRKKINREDLLRIRDFIRTTRNPKVDRKAKVHSAKEALVAIKNLMKLIKKNKLGAKGNSKIGDAFKEAQAMDSDAFMKSKVPKEGKNIPETKGKESEKKATEISSKNKDSHQKHEKKYYLKKLKDLRVKLLKEKLLKVLKLREGDNLNLDLKRLKTKLEAKREKRDAEQEKPVGEQEIRKKQGKYEKEKLGKRKVHKRKHVMRGKMKSNRDKKLAKVSHKEFTKDIRKKIKKLNVIMDKGENERGAKRFELIHGHKSFRKNLISLANLDASKMTDGDLKKLHDKINEWIEVEEKLERETENGEVKDEISSGIDTANDLLSSLKFVGEDGKYGDEKKLKVEGGEKREKKNRNLEITIDINKHGKNGQPSVKIVKDNDGVANVESPNSKEEVSNMYSSGDNQATENPTQSVVFDDGATKTNNQYGGNQERNTYDSNGNDAATASVNSNSGNPNVASQSRNVYLKEMAKAYMDGKAIKNNKNFGEKLRKMEENFENDLNNMENNNNNDNYKKYENNINNNNYGNNIIDNNNKYDKKNNKEIVNSFANNDKVLKPETANVQNVGGSFNANAQQVEASFGGNRQNNNDYMTNENNLNKNRNMNSGNIQGTANSGNKNLPENNPAENNGGSHDGSTGDVANKGGKGKNRLNGDTGSFGNNLNGVSGQNKEAMNEGMVTKGSQGINDGKVGNAGQIAHDDQVTNVGQVPAQVTNVGQLPAQVTNDGQVPGRVTNVGQVPGRITNVGQVPGQVTNVVQVPGQVSNQGILPNGHVITNEADLASQQAKQANEAEENDNNINKAANQLASTMNDGNQGNTAGNEPASNQLGDIHGSAEVKIDQPKVEHFAKKPKTVNPDYDDQDYDYAEAGEEEAEDEKIMAEQKQLPKNKTPFLQSNRQNKFMHQRNPNTPERSDHSRQSSPVAYDESPNDIQQNKNQNQIQSKGNGRPGKIFYHSGKPVLHRNGYRKFAARFQNRQKKLNFQRLNGRFAVDKAGRTGKYYHNFAPSGRFSGKVNQHNSEVQRFTDGDHRHAVQAGYSTQQVPTPKGTYGSNVGENEIGSNGKDNEDMSGSILNGKLIKDDGMNENVHGNRGNGGSTSNEKTTEGNVQHGEENSGNILNGKAMKDDGMNVNTGIKTPEHRITIGEKTPEVDSNTPGETAQDVGSMQPEKLHGKALLNNFLDEETLRAGHTSTGAPQSSNIGPQHDESSEGETEELDEDSAGQQDSSKNPQGLHQGSSNTSPSNSQVLSAESDETESSEGMSDDENSDDDVPKYSATLIDDDDEEMNSSSDVEPSMQENTSHLHRLHQNKKARHRLRQYRYKNLRRLRHRNRHNSALRLKMVHKHRTHFKNDDSNSRQISQDKQYGNIHNLKQLVNNKFSKHKAFGHLPKPKQHKAGINLEKIPDAEAIIRGAIRKKPTKTIHVAKDKPKPKVVAQAKSTKFGTGSNEKVSNEAATLGMLKLQKAEVKLGLSGKKTSPEGAKFIVKQSPSPDQQSSSSADSTSGGGGGGGGGGGVGGFETSGIALPGSQVTTQSFMGEDKFSNLNANDVTSSSDGGAMMSSSASNGMTPSHGGNGMTSPSDADRIAASNDPTELSEYEHNVDIQERTGAGDIVPVGMSSSSPAITSGSNMPAGPTPGGAGAPPEHVLLSPDSAKGDDLLKPLANDPDGKLQALQDLRALTKAQKEEETSATEDSNKISDPAFLEEMSNRISVSGAPINSLGVAHTPTMPIRDIEQPESTLVIPGEKLKRDEKGSSHKTGFQEKNAQFTVDNKVVALGSGTEKEKFLTSPKAAQFQQLEGGASQLHLKTPEPEKSSQEAALGFSPHKPDITNNLAPRITELVKEIVRESLGSGRESKTKKGNGKAADEILDDPSKDAAVLLKSEKLETKPYDGRKNLGGSGRGPGASHRVSPQAHLQAENSKETVFLPNVPPNADGDHVLFGGEPQPTNNAGTMNILSKSNLSDKEKMKLINEYKASQKSSAEPSVQSKPESPTTSPEVDESKITEMLKSGKFNEQDLKSDFAGKEAAMQDMMMLEKEQALDDKLSQAHLQASQASKQNGPGNGLPPGSQQQGNTMSTPGNLSPDITLPGNVSPGASLPETLPAGMTQPGDGLSSDVALPENKLPAAGGQPQMPGFQNQMQGNKPSGERDDQFMMAKDTQMDRLLDQAQQGLPAGMGGENNAGMVKSTKAPQSKLINGFNDAVKSFDDSGFGHTTPNYDAVDPKGISKFVDTVQGLSPAEVKAYGIDVNNDVYIDKPARHRAAAQRSQPSGYTTMGAETGPDMESFNSIRKSEVGRKKSRQSRRL